MMYSCTAASCNPSLLENGVTSDGWCGQAGNCAAAGGYAIWSNGYNIMIAGGLDKLAGKIVLLDPPGHVVDETEVPFHRWKPEELANATVFLCSERASYITGVSLNLDGGRLKGLW